MTNTTERVFGWTPHFDERSRSFRLAAVRGKYRDCDWRHGPILDQGPFGSCVGFAAAANLASTRRQVPLADGNVVGHAIYRFAQDMDEWDGNSYEGTSVLAGMKALKHHGYIHRYEWAFGMPDVLWALSWRGPVQVGVWWFEGMGDTDPQGFIHPTGYRSGGHSVLVSGINPVDKYVTITNSWGPAWGVAGQAKISFPEFEKLLLDNGEAVSILKVRPGVAG